MLWNLQFTQCLWCSGLSHSTFKPILKTGSSPVDVSNLYLCGVCAELTVWLMTVTNVFALFWPGTVYVSLHLLGLKLRCGYRRSLPDVERPLTRLVSTWRCSFLELYTWNLSKFAIKFLSINLCINLLTGLLCLNQLFCVCVFSAFQILLNVSLFGCITDETLTNDVPDTFWWPRPSTH